MRHKINARVLRNLHLHKSLEELRILFQMTLVIVTAPLPLDDTGFENGYPTTEESVCSASGEGRSIANVQHAFRTQFYMEPRRRVFVYA